MGGILFSELSEQGINVELIVHLIDLEERDHIVLWYLLNKVGQCSRGFHTSRAGAIWKSRLRCNRPRILRRYVLCVGRDDLSQALAAAESTWEQVGGKAVTSESRCVYCESITREVLEMQSNTRVGAQ